MQRIYFLEFLEVGWIKACELILDVHGGSGTQGQVYFSGGGVGELNVKLEMV